MKSLNELIKELAVISEASVLLEGQSYEVMFEPLYSFLKHWQDYYRDSKTDENGFNLGDYLKSSFDKKTINDSFDIESVIKHAKSILKKNDRIVWFLKIFRHKIISNLLANNMQTPGAEELKNALEKYARAEESQFIGTAISGGPTPQLLNSLAHFLSLPIPEIQNTVWLKQTPAALIAHFSEYENNWEQKQVQITAQEEHHEVVLKFPDGKAWFNLNREYCEKEGKAMGHCGNKAAYREGDTILSLREPIKSAKGNEWRPLLTFILHEDGNLGEMKGRGNQKPAPQYHNYIIELLKLPIIKGISGGGYAPERNFSMKDLPEKEQEELYELKPALAPISYQYKKKGMTKELLTAIKNKVKDVANKDIEYISETKSFLLENIADIKDFISHASNDRDNSLTWMLDIIQGNEQLWYDGELHGEEIRSMINDFSKETKNKIINYVEKKYKDYMSEMDEDDIVKTLIENDDNLYDELKHAWRTGWEAGTQDEIYEKANEALTDWHYMGILLSAVDFGENIAKIICPEVSFIELLADDSFLEDVYDTSEWVPRGEGPTFESRYGFDNFEIKYAEEYFLENADISTEKKKEKNNLELDLDNKTTKKPKLKTKKKKAKK
jgi:hypothetical protein